MISNITTKSFSEVYLNDSQTQYFIGEAIGIEDVLNKEIVIKYYRQVKSRFNNRIKIGIQILYNKMNFVLFTTSKVLIDQLHHISEFPFKTKITKLGFKQKFYSFI